MRHRQPMPARRRSSRPRNAERTRHADNLAERITPGPTMWLTLEIVERHVDVEGDLATAFTLSAFAMGSGFGRTWRDVTWRELMAVAAGGTDSSLAADLTPAQARSMLTTLDDAALMERIAADLRATLPADALAIYDDDGDGER